MHIRYLFSSRSLPARSTRFRTPINLVLDASCSPVMYIMKTECDREEVAFMAVASVARVLFARCKIVIASSMLAMDIRRAPTTVVWPTTMPR